MWDADEVMFNSNSKYDWVNQVDFDMTNQCRFHTTGLYKFYFRIFHLNPVRSEDGNWTRDNGGIEVAFRIPKGEKIFKKILLMSDKYILAVKGNISPRILVSMRAKRLKIHLELVHK